MTAPTLPRRPLGMPVGSFVRILAPTGRHIEGPARVGEVIDARFGGGAWSYDVQVAGLGVQRYTAGQVGAV